MEDEAGAGVATVDPVGVDTKGEGKKDVDGEDVDDKDGEGDAKKKSASRTMTKKMATRSGTRSAAKKSATRSKTSGRKDSATGREGSADASNAGGTDIEDRDKDANAAEKQVTVDGINVEDGKDETALAL